MMGYVMVWLVMEKRRAPEHGTKKEIQKNVVLIILSPELGAVGRQIVLLAMQLDRLDKEGVVQWLVNVQDHHPEQSLAPLALLALISHVRVKHINRVLRLPALAVLVNKAIAALITPLAQNQ